MPLVVREGKYRVVVHTRMEHPPPHVHVYWEDSFVRVGLLTLTFMDPAPRRRRREILELLRAHQLKAIEIWEQCNEQK